MRDCSVASKVRPPSRMGENAVCRAGGAYTPRLKTKCFTQSTFVVVGTDRDRKTGALRALLAHKDSAGLSYAGAAFIALGGEERTRFFAELERFATSWTAFKSSRPHGC
jgi:ATP-dependent DNA ligase